ncbi:MAG: hypothetical protein GC147_03375 [Porphyrobacter sp.]|nr:hypothetical protein [Porphyrobacter sp.]
MTASDEAWLAPLRAKFAAGLPERRAMLVAMHGQGDRQGLADLAHKLAGIAGMMGAPVVGEASLQLEEALRSGGEGTAEFGALIAAIDDVLG